MGEEGRAGVWLSQNGQKGVNEVKMAGLRTDQEIENRQKREKLCSKYREV